MKTINLKEIMRPHLQGLAPYSSARDDFQGQAQVYLDANENPFDTGFNRYPDPHQHEIKERLSEIKSVSTENIFLGNGSDEAIDLLLRAFCEPGKDSIVILPPTYGMYKVSAKINNIEVKEVLLDENFDVDVDTILMAITPRTKLIFLCSPNNPTGNSLSPARIRNILDKFNGLVIVDEAYIDFIDGESLTSLLGEYQNLVVLQTLSKAWGMASLRLGMCLAHKEIIGLLNKIKPPYNISGPNQQQAKFAIDHSDQFMERVKAIKSQREWLTGKLQSLPMVERVFPSEANFLLVKTKNANAIYQYLTEQGIIVRNRSKEPGCENCLRITVGTKNENELLIKKLSDYERT
jgi:histidinol-phosphate aminotransferase